jgi:hypothetical protein
LEWPDLLVAVSTGVKRQAGKSGSAADAASTIFNPFPKHHTIKSIFQFLLNNGTKWAVEKCKKAMCSKDR